MKKLKQLKKIKYALIYNRDGRINQDGTALVQIRAYQGGRPARCRYFSTGVYVEPQHWDERNKRVKPNHPLHFQYNKQLRDHLEAIEAFEIQTIQRYGACCLVTMLDGYREQEAEAPLSFLAFCREEINRPEITASTRHSQRHSINKLTEYRKEIFFEDLTFSLIQGFDRYLIRNGIALNTRDRHHRTIKAYINLAIKYGHLEAEANPYRLFQSKTEEPDREFLSPEELARLEALTIPADQVHLERIRRIFLLACYTGLRFGDLSRFGHKHLEETAKGLQLSIRTEKNRTQVTLPLWLLFRRDGIQWSRPEEIIRQALTEHGKLYRRGQLQAAPLFRISNQYLNRGLKELARLADIDKRLTSHVGRRTFATYMATKVKTPVLQRLLNHSRIDITMIYVRLSNRMIEEELEAIDWQW